MKDLLAAKETALSWLKPVSREILNWFQKEITVQQKADQSPVTIADQKAEEICAEKYPSVLSGSWNHRGRIW